MKRKKIKYLYELYFSHSFAYCSFFQRSTCLGIYQVKGITSTLYKNSSELSILFDPIFF